MLQQRNSILERQLNRVLRSNIIKLTPDENKEKRKRNSSSNDFDNFDMNTDNIRSLEEKEKGNSVEYFEIEKFRVSRS